MTEQGDDASILMDRIAKTTGRPVVFLFGAALTKTQSPGTAGIVDVKGMVERLQKLLDRRGARTFDEALSTAAETQKGQDYSRAYRAGFAALLRRRGQDEVNRVIRESILDAHQPVNDELRKKILASHPSDYQAACSTLLENLENWKPLPQSVSALGDILAQKNSHFKTILTTNFDPLIEISVRRSGGSAHISVLDRDGDISQNLGQGTHIVHLHGYWTKSDTLHTQSQLEKPRPKLEATLRRLIERSLLVVIGYGGWDDVLTRSIKTAVSTPELYPDIAWACYQNADEELRTMFSEAGERIQFYEQINIHQPIPQLRDILIENKDTTETEPKPRHPSPTTFHNHPPVPGSLSEKLEAAYLQREQMVINSEGTDEIDQKILHIKRQQRQGPSLHEGEFLADGRFRLVEAVGRGGFATVWKAYDRKYQQLVAIKVLHGQFAQDASRRERLFRGARKMAEIQHPHIARVIVPNGEEQGFHYYVMEYAANGDLNRAVTSRSIDTKSAMAILQQVAKALEHTHSQGIIHRDVKPANILIREDGTSALTDFDLVQAKDTTGGTRTGALGTVLYAAPEQNEDASRVDHRVDIFGLGMTGVFCVHGSKLPFSAMYGRNEFLSKLQCADKLRKVLSKAVELDPKQRFRDMSVLRRELAIALSKQKINKPKQTRAASKRKPTSTKRSIQNRKHGTHTIETSRRGGLKLILIPGGRFWMGSPADDKEAYDREKPQHEVTLASFWLAQTPVTNEQYRRFLRDPSCPSHVDEPKYWNNPSYNQRYQPVVGVSWNEAKAYCDWAGLTLPTEAQWEYACRAGSTTRYWPGDNEEGLRRAGWYSMNSGKRLHLTGEKPENRFGLIDMHGNVNEWCEDTWIDNYEDAEHRQNDGLRIGPEDVSSRVFRGGYFRSSARDARSAFRGGYGPSERYGMLGFRPAKNDRKP